MHGFTDLPVTALLCAALAAPALAQEPEQQPGKTELRKTANAAFTTQDFEKAVATFRKLADMKAMDAQSWHRLGYSLHALGKLDDALEIHEKAAEFPQTRAVASYNVACVHALKGDVDEALAWLEKAAEAGFTNTSHMATDPDMANLRDDPRYGEIVAKMKEAAGGFTGQAFENNSVRGNTRIFLWGGSSSAGQVVIDYGRPDWKASYTEALASDEYVDKRWRLGQNFWTNLDTNVDLTIGEVEVPAGYYYLALEYGGNDDFALVLLDPADVRKKKLDAFQAAQTEGGIEIPVKHEETGETESQLRIALEKAGAPIRCRLAIRFGPHRLTAPVEIHLDGY